MRAWLYLSSTALARREDARRGIPDPGSPLEAPTYTRDELEERLEQLKSQLENSAFRELIEWGFELETRGRELASRREEPVGEEDRKWFSDLYEWHRRLLDAFQYDLRYGAYCMFLANEDECNVAVYVLRDLSELSRDLSEYGGFGVDRSVNRGGMSRKTPLYKFTSDLVLTGLLEDYDKAQRKLTGKGCVWLLGNVPREQYTWSAFLNDVTACFHRVLTWFTLKFGNVVKVAEYPEVYASADSAQLAVELARLWSDAAYAYYEWGLLDEEDFNALVGVIRGNQAEFQVGSGEGHATHVEFYPTHAIAEYYDVVEERHRVFMKLCEHYGCEILEHRRREVTVVRIPRESLADFFQGVLPLVTSMDYRLDKPCEHWCEHFEEEYEELSEQVEDPVELEFRLCLKAYERLKKEEEEGEEGD